MCVLRAPKLRSISPQLSELFHCSFSVSIYGWECGIVPSLGQWFFILFCVCAEGSLSPRPSFTGNWMCSCPTLTTWRSPWTGGTQRPINLFSSAYSSMVRLSVNVFPLEQFPRKQELRHWGAALCIPAKFQSPQKVEPHLHLTC